jgi:multimeric flavodoxin WrbA
MRVVAINGSARKDSNTERLINAVFGPLREAGIECELINLAGKDIRGCTACQKCREMKDGQCHGRKDFGNEVIDRAREADGLILGSPTYFADVSSEMKAVIDRLGYVSMGNGGFFKRKPGAAVVAVRRGGAIHVVDTLNHFFLISQMLVVGSTYWNMVYGREKGEVEGDAEGMRNMVNLGENMAWLLGKIAE